MGRQIISKETKSVLNKHYNAKVSSITMPKDVYEKFRHHAFNHGYSTLPRFMEGILAALDSGGMIVAKVKDKRFPHTKHNLFEGL